MRRSDTCGIMLVCIGLMAACAAPPRDPGWARHTMIDANCRNFAAASARIEYPPARGLSPLTARFGGAAASGLEGALPGLTALARQAREQELLDACRATAQE